MNGYNDPFILETGHQKHMNMILYTCAFCEQSFDNQPAKNLHLALWHYDKTEVTNEFNIEDQPTNVKAVIKKCNFCDSEFSLGQTLQTHKRQIHGSNIKSFKCKTCGKAFFDKWILSLHVKSVHEKIKTDFNVLKTYCCKDILVKHVNKVHYGP